MVVYVNVLCVMYVVCYICLLCIAVYSAVLITSVYT